MPTYTLDVVSFGLGVLFGIVLFIALVGLAAWTRGQGDSARYGRVER